MHINTCTTLTVSWASLLSLFSSFNFFYLGCRNQRTGNLKPFLRQVSGTVSPSSHLGVCRPFLFLTTRNMSFNIFLGKCPTIVPSFSTVYLSIALVGSLTIANCCPIAAVHIFLYTWQHWMQKAISYSFMSNPIVFLDKYTQWLGWYWHAHDTLYLYTV